MRLTDGEVREGLVDGQDVARGAVRGLFGGLEVVVRDDVVVRVDALAGGARSSVLMLAIADRRGWGDLPTTPGPSSRGISSGTPRRSKP